MKVLLMTSYAGIGFNNAPPLGLYRLKNFLKKIDVSCDILDLSLTGYNEVLRKVENGEYQIIGMSVSHYNMREDLSIIWKFKRACNDNKCLFIAGGQEATYNYKKWIKAGIDVVFLGYAERSLAELSEHFKSGFDYGISMLNTIDGIAFCLNDEILFRPSEPMTKSEFKYLTYDQVMDLDVSFTPYWDQVRNNSEGLNFWTTVFVEKMVRLYTSSHCPHRCGFCSSHRFLTFSQQKTAPIFMLNAEQVFNLTLRYIEKYGAKGFLFSDDEFLVSKKRATTLCDYIIDAKNDGIINKDIVFNCQTRVSDFLLKTEDGTKVDHNLIGKLVNAGFHSIGIGVETFCDRLLMSPSMNKKGFREEDALRVLQAMLERGLIPQVNIILFIPEATREEIIYSIQKGIHFIKKGCQVAVTPLLYAVPGAPIFEDSRYPVVTEKYRNNENGKLIEITKNFIPNNPDVECAADRILDIFEEEYCIFEKSGVWKFNKIPKTIIGILMFVSASKLLGNKDLAEECHNLIHTLIKKN